MESLFPFFDYSCFSSEINLFEVNLLKLLHSFYYNNIFLNFQPNEAALVLLDLQKGFSRSFYFLFTMLSRIFFKKWGDGQ